MSEERTIYRTNPARSDAMMELMSGAPPAWGIGAANAREIDERTVTKKASLKDIANGVTGYGRNSTINIGR